MSDVSDLLAAQKKQKRFAAPRRFDLVTMLVVTLAYALLFAGMKVLDFSSSAFIRIASLITLVAIAQSLFATWEKPRQVSFLFSNDPRQVSVIVGIAFYVFFMPWMYGAAFFWQEIQRGVSLGPLVMSLPAILLPGTLMGYFSGVLVAGVFLVADRLRGGLGLMRRNRKADEGQDIATSPWDE